MKALLAFAILVGPGAAHADQTFNSGKGGTWDCAKDPEVTINTSNGSYTLSGACTAVSINGSSLNVTIEAAGEVQVNGSKSNVSIGAVDQVSVSGSANRVTWNRGLSVTAPSVSATGSGNTVKAGATSSTAPTALTTFECTKRKAATVLKIDKGSYKVVGTCGHVSIAASDATVSIEGTTNLAVSGSRNTVTVGKVDKIAATGGKNTVTYGGGLTVAQPTVAMLASKGNVIGLSGAVPVSATATSK